MPFGTLITKLSQVNLSDLNHELGKAKESLESGVREAASQSGSILRSESSRLGSYWGGRSTTGLPKSCSLPALSPSPCQPCRSRGPLGDKYKYRSTALEDPLVSPQDLLDEESVVNRFIKVVGAEEGVNPGKSRQEEKGREEGGERSITSTREDIRKKLASWGEEEEEEQGRGGREKEERGENNNLEICFINETASDEEEESFRNPLDEEEEESEDEFEEEVRTAIPRSKSEGFCLMGGGEEGRGQRVREEKKKKQLQSAARVALAQCSAVAKRQMIMERQRRSANSRLRQLLGVGDSDLTPRLLASYNINTLQVILNDFRERIEQYNGELVKMLMEKDELQQEQEGVLMDIEDLGCEE